MKQVLLFACSIFSGVFLNAQTINYHPLHGDYSQYVYRFQWWDGSQANEAFYKTVWSGDTTIGGQTYTRIFRNSIYAGGIREDIANQQRFFINANDIEKDITIDYDLPVGAILTDSSVYMNAFRTYLDMYGLFAYDTLVVWGVDSVLQSSGNYSATYTLTRPQGDGESIRFNTYSGLLELNGFEYNYAQLCYREDGEQTPPGQETPWTIMCDLGISAENIQTISLYPNPSNEVIALLNKDLADIHEAVIYDLQGNKIKDVETTELNTEIQVKNLKEGVYFLSINQGTKVLRFQKM